MAKQLKSFIITLAFLVTGTAYGQSNLQACRVSDASKWSNCFGTADYPDGRKYIGEFKVALKPIGFNLNFLDLKLKPIRQIIYGVQSVYALLI